tara:strand:+ start:2725 stop:3114 length:390 start_codon:yes stop_codon:yes gene_type:complete
MDTFDLLETLVKNSTFSRGKLVSLLKKYPLDKFTTQELIDEILNEKGSKFFNDPEDFVIYLFNESKIRKLTLAQNNKKRKIMKQKEEDSKRKRELTSTRKLQKTLETINSQESCNSCGAVVNINGLCRC